MMMVLTGSTIFMTDVSTKSLTARVMPTFGLLAQLHSFTWNFSMRRHKSPCENRKKQDDERSVTHELETGIRKIPGKAMLFEMCYPLDDFHNDPTDRMIGGWNEEKRVAGSASGRIR
jgi:hypothetical protein